MRRILISATLFAALASAACTTPAPVAVGDYCARASRVELRDLCAVGEAPALSPDGWGSCSLTTRADAVRLAAEARKYDRACPAPRGAFGG
jgi:hypothetical protein